MTIGSPFARPWRDGANILRTLLSLLLSCALALSLAPSAAWAASGEVGDAAVGDVPAPAVPSDGQPAAQADESPAPDDPAPDSSADGTLDAVPPSADESPSGSVAGGSVAGTEAAGGPGEGSGAPDVADGREGSAASAENARRGRLPESIVPRGSCRLVAHGKLLRLDHVLAVHVEPSDSCRIPICGNHPVCERLEIQLVEGGRRWHVDVQLVHVFHA